MAKILVRDDSAAVAGVPPMPDAAWYLLGWIGLVFAVVGWTDILLTWYPFRAGNPEWEFGTVTATLNNLPLPSLGLVLVLGAALARGQRWLARSVAVILVLVAIAILVAAVLYVLTLPVALRTVQNPVLQTGIKKAVVKTSVQALVYPVGFVWVAIQARRFTRRPRT